MVIHFQGGAFVTAMEPDRTGQLPSRIFAEKMGATTLYLQYGLARTEGARIPAAAQDDIAFYQYVLDLGVDSKNIIISGDSAGGGVALALLRCIEGSKEGVGLLSPRGAMVWSPWVDVRDLALAQYRKSPHLQIDFLPLALTSMG